MTPAWRPGSASPTTPGAGAALAVVGHDRRRHRLGAQSVRGAALLGPPAHLWLLFGVRGLPLPARSACALVGVRARVPAALVIVA